LIEISVVIPVYRGEKSIVQLVEHLQVQLHNEAFEVVLVNDGSPDDSAKVCRQLTQKYKNVQFISLRKNFGEFNAVMCGLNFVKGTYVVIIDDDFQNPPSEILKLVNEARQHDYDVVYSFYDEKKHSLFRNLGSQLVNYLTTFLLKKPNDLYLSSFKLIHREVVEEVIKYQGPFPYIDGLIFRVTNNVGKVMVEHNEREHGESNYTLRRLVSLFLTILFGYSLIPIRLTLFAGLFSIFFAIIYMVLYFLKIVGEWGSPVVIFLSGVILSSLALMGEYLGKNYMTVNGTPQYVIKEKIIQDAD
jgi:glycosyltransferase involved in cell wall biosynthesis